MRDRLNTQADLIEQLLLAHGLPCQVTGGVATTRLARFDLCPGAGVRLAQIEALADDLALRLGVESLRVGRAGTVVTVEIAGVVAASPSFMSLFRRIGRLPAETAILGIGSDGTPVGLRLGSPEVVHALVAGTTGSGKTELARAMLASLALANPPDSLRVALIDPKGRSFAGFAELPHLLSPVACTAAQASSTLRWLVCQMEERDRSGCSSPCLVLFVDELAELLAEGGAELTALMGRLTQRGRSAGIHIIACIQRPASESMATVIRSNFPTRLVGRMTSPEDARIASGISGSGAERLAGRGDFLVVNRGQVMRFQAARCRDVDAAAVVQSIRQALAKQLAPAGDTRHEAVVGL